MPAFTALFPEGSAACAVMLPMIPDRRSISSKTMLTPPRDAVLPRRFLTTLLSSLYRPCPVMYSDVMFPPNSSSAYQYFMPDAGIVRADNIYDFSSFRALSAVTQKTGKPWPILYHSFRFFPIR